MAVETSMQKISSPALLVRQLMCLNPRPSSVPSKARPK